jgi:hypothetical protein
MQIFECRIKQYFIYKRICDGRKRREKDAVVGAPRRVEDYSF